MTPLEREQGIETDAMIFELLKCGLLRVDMETGDVYSGALQYGRPRTKKIGSVSSSGYLTSAARLSGKRKQISLHRVVMAAKLGHQLPAGSYIDHINRITTDNRPENLRLADPHTNSQNRRSYEGAGSPSAKYTEEQVAAIRAHYKTSNSCRKTAKAFSMSRSYVWFIVARKVWKHVP